jgi:rhodanese-related sulfurtransferase
MKTPAKALVIVLLGAGLGLAGNQLSPRGLPLIAPRNTAPAAGDFIPLDQAKHLWQRGDVPFLDARAQEDYAAGHIGNALSLPANSFEQQFGEVAPLLARDSEIVIYCDGEECELSHRLAGRLRQAGYANLHILRNGWTAWRQASLPTASGGPQ